MPQQSDCNTEKTDLLEMPTSSDGNCHMHIITVRCNTHGPHRVIIAGLDDRADRTADYLMDALREAGDEPEIMRSVMPLEEAVMASKLGILFDVGL